METLQWLNETDDDDNDYLNVYKIDPVNVIIQDKQMPIIRTSSLIILRNLMEPLSTITKDILQMCYYFHIDHHSIISHSIEFFDKFFENILDLAISKSIIWLSNKSIVLNDISIDFGSKLKMIHDYGECFDYLYLILFGFEIPGNIRDLYDRNYYRTLCIAICILIASQVYGEQSSIKAKDISHLMQRIQAPAELCQIETIRSIEINILNSMNYNTTIIKPLNILVETLLSNVIGFINHHHNINVENFLKISQLITENYYLLRYEIVWQLFRNEYRIEFDITSLEHIISFENLYRNRMLIAAGIVASVFYLNQSKITNHHQDEILQFLSNMITTVSIDRIRQCRDIIIQLIC
ncbi:uncharacterized protein LOC113790910 [Dermatophagoides pteronyssinus]|uniref:uncharacterized protein LOC113790910 n=1 Tax=Dermatophagoides pteronyssinus TaxID=6956 RepID=UPI003F6696FF